MIVQKYEERPLVLHTLPAAKGKSPEAQTDVGADGGLEVGGGSSAGPKGKAKKKEGLQVAPHTSPL